MSTSTPMPTTPSNRSSRMMSLHWLAWAALVAMACSVLWGVFTMYASPNFMVDIANQLWSCF